MYPGLANSIQHLDPDDSFFRDERAIFAMKSRALTCGICALALGLLACSLPRDPTYPPLVDSAGHLATVRVTGDLAARVAPNGSLSFPEAWHDRAGWQPHPMATPTFGFTDAIHWLRFTVENTGPEAAPLILLINNEYIDQLKIYGVRTDLRDPDSNPDRSILPGSTIPISFELPGGRELPFHQRVRAERKFAFELNLAGTSQYEILISAGSRNSLNVPIFLLNPQDYNEWRHQENLRMGLYGGLFILLLVTNLSVFFALRERLFLFYLAYLLFNFLYQFSLQGYAYKYLWPDSPYWASIFNLLVFCPSVALGALFCCEFLDLKKRHPWTHRLLLIQVIFWALLPFGLLFWSLRELEYVTAAITGPAAVMFVYFAAWQALLAGYRPARFYVVGWTLYFPFACSYILQINGVFPNGMLGMDMLENLAIAISLEMLVFPFAIADRIRMRLQPRDLNAHPENRKEPSGSPGAGSARATRLDQTEVSRRLDEAMHSRKLYREQLSLAALAKEIDLGEKDLSSYLNDVLGQSFYALLNEHRIAEAKDLLLQNQNEKIIAVAHAVGFQSLSTFQSAFRKLVGMSPREFRKRGGSPGT